MFASYLMFMLRCFLCSSRSHHTRKPHPKQTPSRPINYAKTYACCRTPASAGLARSGCCFESPQNHWQKLSPAPPGSWWRLGSSRSISTPYSPHPKRPNLQAIRWSFIDRHCRHFIACSHYHPPRASGIHSVQFLWTYSRRSWVSRHTRCSPVPR